MLAKNAKPSKSNYELGIWKHLSRNGDNQQKRVKVSASGKNKTDQEQRMLWYKPCRPMWFFYYGRIQLWF